MPMFIAALVTKAKRWKQSKCPSINEWISKKWDNHTIEYYSASKRKKILTHAATRMNLENMFCEISQSYVCDIVHEAVIKIIPPKKRNAKRQNGCLRRAYK